MDLSEAKASGADLSDLEGDTFEDAPDTSSDTPNHIRSSSNTSIRSLTDGRPSSASSRSLTDPKESSTPVRSSTLDMPERESSGTLSAEATPRPSKVQPPSEEKTDGSIPPSPQDVTMAFKAQPDSPLQTARLDVASFDEVQLSAKERVEAKEAQEVAETNEVVTEKADAVEQRGRSASASSNTSERSRSRSSNPLAQFPFFPTNQSSADTKPMPSVMSRKLTSPFAWLSRKKTSPHPDSSPPASTNRRRTATTGAAVSSTPGSVLRQLDEEKVLDSHLPAKELLKERFKLLRMREEAGINIDQLTSDPRESMPSSNGSASQTHSRPTSQAGPDVGLGIGIRVPKNVLEEEDHSLAPGTPASSGPAPPAPAANESHKSRSNSVASHSTVDPTLAPGTVAGMSAGPSAMQDPEAPVDWDLWQAVVYEGPAAVAKTSPAELGRAIAGGIPSAIRGVVWQVLAGSKNEELEGVYRELVARGTDKELAPSPQLAAGSAPHSANSMASAATTASTHKDSVPSGASSEHEHSAASTPATTNPMTSPVHATAPSLDGDANAAKVQAAMGAERQKKAKQDLAALRKLEKTIRKDLGSRSNYSKYAAATGMQDALFGVCKAYALFDEAVGYAQGMNFIVMPLLFNMPEEEAFCLLVKVMNQYGLREMFIQDMPGLHLHLYQFERLLEDLEPALCYHLHRRGVVPSLYATQWFLTLFAYRFPLQLVLRIYDLILSDSLSSALLKFALALMRKNAAALLALQDMGALKTFLNERLFDAYIDAAPSQSSLLESGFFGHVAAASGAGAGAGDRDVYRADLLVQDASAVPVAPEVLRAYAADFAARARAEREREAEVEGLRAANASLALRIRGLEARAEKSDADHVHMAGEMIRSKVETEELQAQNGELQGQVAGLRAVVDGQPAEVEARLKAEMDRIMSRNIEVQNENRALEEAMAEMEKDLVETKLRFAEVNSEYDGLKQKWADLRRALGD